LPNVSEWAANLFPNDKGQPPAPEVLLVALKDIQSTQQQHATALQEHSALLQQNAALLQQQSATFDVLRHGLTDEKSDVKKDIVPALDAGSESRLAPKCNNIGDHLLDSKRSSAYSRKRIARPLKPAGSISLGGAPPATTPAQVANPMQSPEG
jgi:hypothetical protein